MKSQNVVGAQIRKLRFQQQLTQEMLTARCRALGWDLSRGTLAKIEAQVRRVTDRELWYLGRALRVTLKDLFPRKVTPPTTIER